MSCPENQADCCPPPGGGGIVTLPELTGGLPWYYPWEVDSTLAFQPTSISGNRASGHVITYDGLFKRQNALVATTHTQLDTYLAARSVQLAERAWKISAAKIAFHDQSDTEWPDYPGGGVVLNEDGPLAMGDVVRFHPFSYPASACACMVLRTDPVTVEAIFPDGRRTIRGVRVLHKGAEFNEFLRLQGIWTPLYNAAIAEVDAEYPQP